MTWTKSQTKTLPATGGRTVKLYTEGGIQYVDYMVVDNDGDGHSARFTVAAVLAAHPEIDAPTLAATLAIFRAYGDAQCGFSEV
jgi:hypothetical protein